MSGCSGTVKARPQKDTKVVHQRAGQVTAHRTAPANGNRQVRTPSLMWGTENNNYCIRKDKVAY